MFRSLKHERCTVYSTEILQMTFQMKWQNSIPYKICIALLRMTHTYLKANDTHDTWVSAPIIKYLGILDMGQLIDLKTPLKANNTQRSLIHNQNNYWSRC